MSRFLSHSATTYLLLAMAAPMVANADPLPTMKPGSPPVVSRALRKASKVSDTSSTSNHSLRMIQYQGGSAEVVRLPTPEKAISQDPLAELIGGEGLRGVGQLTIDIRPKELRDGKPGGDVPANLAATVLNSSVHLSDGRDQRGWAPICFQWEASGLFFQPLYFEETNLERYGYSIRGLRMAQPLISAATFFLTIPTLPYQMSLHPPQEHVYALGYYRPGSPAPFRLNRPKLSLKAGLVEASAIIGLILIIP